MPASEPIDVHLRLRLPPVLIVELQAVADAAGRTLEEVVVDALSDRNDVAAACEALAWLLGLAAPPVQASGLADLLDRNPWALRMVRELPRRIALGRSQEWELALSVAAGRFETMQSEDGKRIGQRLAAAIAANEGRSLPAAGPDAEA